ncbi:MAG: alpha/beta hydrolase [Gammaproteobacteria bacterium]
MNKPASPEWIVLVPGIYMPGLSLAVLARRLRKAGFQCRIFSYPSLRVSVDENAARLYRSVQTLNAATVHYVGHSLGGIVIRHLMARHSASLPAGHTVTLGTPHTGSKVARKLQQHHLGWLLGRSREHGLLGDLPDWPRARALGSLAGVYRYGLGRLLAPLDFPHDGTVEVAETVCPEATDRICLPVNHTSLLLDAQTAWQIIFFLRNRRFDHSMGSTAAKC